MTTTILAVVAATLIAAWAIALVLLWDRLWPVDLAAGGERGLKADPFDVGAVLVTAALLTMVGGGLTGPVRVVLALGFVTFVPGWALLGLVPPLKVIGGGPPMNGAAVVGHVPLVTGMTKVAVAVAVSLTLCTLTAQVQLWLNLWNPSALLGGLGGLSLAALAAPFVRTSTLPIAVAR